jgi:hypothetical protein
MVDINVTAIKGEDCSLLSASQAELGERAGQITWSNCMRLAKRLPLVTGENRDDIREHFQAYGAWDEDEINAWDDIHLSAMVWQEAASGFREFEDYCDSDFTVYQRKAEEGAISGRLYFSADQVWIYLGC